jgi:hypothetical protein
MLAPPGARIRLRMEHAYLITTEEPEHLSPGIPHILL